MDMDTVELCNVGNQMYREEEVGMRKVEAVKKRIISSGFRGGIYTYFLDVNIPSESFYLLRNCTVYLSCLDTYQSRVNFFYHIVMESATKNRIYIDCGAERFKGHCFFTFTAKTSPCIYCIRWLFQTKEPLSNLCSIRSSIPEEEYFTQERKESVIMAIFEKQKKVSGGAKSESERYISTANQYNKQYKKQEKISEEEVKRVVLTVLPNIPPVSQIIGSLVFLVLIKESRGTNFILYVGDGDPIFHLHLLQKDPACFLCAQ